MNKVRAAVVGASGYTGEELVRILLRHPGVDLTAVTSRQQAGQRLDSFYGLNPGSTHLTFTDTPITDLATCAEVFFLALPHGLAPEFAAPLRAAHRRVFDLSADFRLKNPALYQEFYGAPHPAPELLTESVYGLPELNRNALATADLIACPGCYPTSIQLALAPAITLGWINPTAIVINSLSGVSGAGRKADLPLLFCECAESAKPYSFPTHRHHPEIEQELSRLAGRPLTVAFTPHLIPVVRGMLSTISAPWIGPDLSDADLAHAAADFYQGCPFINVLPPPAAPEIKKVARTNRCDLTYRRDRRTGRLLALSAIDNLGKGAAAQAVQAFNLRSGFPETCGLV